MRFEFLMLTVCIASGHGVHTGPSILTADSKLVDSKDVKVVESPEQTTTPIEKFVFVPGSEQDSLTELRYTTRFFSLIEFAHYGRSLIMKLAVKSKYRHRKTYFEITFGDGKEYGGYLPGAYVDGRRDVIKVTRNYRKPGVYHVSLFASFNYTHVKEQIPSPLPSCIEGASIFPVTNRDPLNPMTAYVTDNVKILANGTVAQRCGSRGSFRFSWRMYQLTKTSVKPVRHLQANTSAFLVSKGSLPGLYIVWVAMTFSGSTMYAEDYMYLRLVLPELRLTMNGGDMLRFPHGQTYTADASLSRDPVTSLASVTANLSLTWRVLHADINQEDLFYYSYSFTTDSLMKALGKTVTVHEYHVEQGIEHKLVLQTSVFPDHGTVLIMLTGSSDVRNATIIQSLGLVKNTTTWLNIACIYNCDAGRHGMMAQDKLQLEGEIHGQVDLNGLSFSWQVYRLDTSTKTKDPFATATSETGFNQKSLSLLPEKLIAGDTYLIVFRKNDDTGNTTCTGHTAAIIRTVNKPPYSGRCEINPKQGSAASTLFTVQCDAWLDDGEGDVINVRDASRTAVLVYSVKQKISGAAVPEEIIAQSRMKAFHFYLKLGDVDDGYKSVIIISVTDMYLGETNVDIDMQTTDVLGVTNLKGPTAVELFMAPILETATYYHDLGDEDTVLSIALTAANHLNNIQLPEGGGSVMTMNHDSILDLDLDSSSDSDGEPVSFNSVLENVYNVTVDPTTLAIQEAFEKIMEIVAKLMDTALDGDVNNDVMKIRLLSIFINIIYKPVFVSKSTKFGVVERGKRIADSSDMIENPVPDNPEKQKTAKNMVVLTGKTVDAAVPATIADILPVHDQRSSRDQIGALLVITGGNISQALYSSRMSPDERAYLFLKKQQQIHLEVEDERVLAEQTAKSALALAESVLNSTELCLSCNKVIGDDENQQFVTRNYADQLATQRLAAGKSSVVLDGLHDLGNTTVSTSVVFFNKNVFMYDDNWMSALITSGVMHVDVKSTNSKRTVGYVTYEQEVSSIDVEVVTPNIDPEDASQFSVHQFIYRNNEEHVCFIIRPWTDDVLRYNVYVRFVHFPTIIDYDVNIQISSDDDWTKCLEAVRMKGHTGLVYIGIQIHLQDIGANTEAVLSAANNSTNTEDQGIVYPPYNFSIATMACMVWSEKEKRWKTRNCEVDWLVNVNKIRCTCRDVSQMTLASSFFKAPNTIDFSTVFLRFSPLSQAAVIGTLVAIVLVYLIACLWARREDKQDITKWGVTSLADNLYEDKYHYIIQVHTGLRPWSGTKSRVYFLLCGLSDETGVRELHDDMRQGFATGSVHEYVMSVPQCLNNLDYLRIWHDNTGPDNEASWYLSKMVVIDLKLGQKFTFLCEQWMSVEEGSLECVVPVSGAENISSFSNRFYVEAKERLAEGHLWFSVLYRPVPSPFTRVQRATCVLVYVLLSMLANALYYNPTDNYVSLPVVSVGPLRFTAEQLYVSAVSALISTPASMLVVVLFRRSRRCVAESENQNTSSRRYAVKVPGMLQRFEARIDSDLVEKCTVLPGEPSYEGFYLPHYCNYLAWFLAWLIIGTCAFFIMLFSIEWGKQKSEEWLTSFLLSLLESLACIDPIMILSMALLIACVCKKDDSNRSAECLGQIVEYMQRTKMGGYRCDTLGFLEYMRYRSACKPLSSKALKKARRRRQHELQMRATIRDVIYNVLFLWILFSLAYNNRSEMSYTLHSHIESTLLNIPHGTASFKHITTIKQFYSWLNDTMLPKMFPEKDINGYPLHWTYREFIHGFECYRLGPPRIRQVRVPQERCSVPQIQSFYCANTYSTRFEDTGDYCIGWERPPCQRGAKFYNASTAAWEHTSAFDIWGLPIPGDVDTYSGGGYMVDLAVSYNISVEILNELYNTMWIDGQTRAVMVETTLYCGSTNMFVYNMYMTEFPATGGAVTSYSILPLRIYQHIGTVGNYIIFCEVVFFVQLILSIFKIAVALVKGGRAAAREFWIVFDMALAAVKFVAVVLYFVRAYVLSLTIDKYKSDLKSFVEFRHIALADESLVGVFGLILFMSMLRLLKIMESNKNVRAIAAVFANAATDLAWLGLYLVYILTGFAFLGYLIFGSRLYPFMNIFKTFGTLFITLVGKNKYSELNQTDPVLAKLFYAVYVLTTVFFMLSIFVASMNTSIDSVIQNIRRDRSEELVGYLWRKIGLMVANIGRRKLPNENEHARATRPIPARRQRRNFRTKPCRRIIFQ